jgi:hypothetical protein
MKRIFILLFFLIWSVPMLAQQSESKKFSDFVSSLEKTHNVRFYFDPKWVDSLMVDGLAEDLKLPAILDKIFSGTDLNYTIDDQQNVFVMRKRALISGLPSGLIAGAGTVSAEDESDLGAFSKKVKQDQGKEDFIYVLGSRSAGLNGTATVTGTVRDFRTGEPLVGVAVFLQDPLIGTTTDALGQFNITLPKGKRFLQFQSLGMKPVRRILMIYQDGKIDVELEEEITPLKDVVISAERDQAVQGVLFGKEKLDIKSIRQMPMALGETDVIKTVLALPGVQTVGEGAGGINVRGGATNQNLILFNGATVYNPSHLFGFFSTFNPDIVKSIELYKSGLEADKGGRLSSVLDVTSREGNLKRFTATGGLSPITGRLTLEGPLIKEKTSFVLAARSTYSDWILRQIKNDQFNKSTATFSDYNFNLNHKLNNNNQLMLSAYSSQDKFRLNSDTTYSYNDRNASLRWSHRFGGKNFTDFTAAISNYNFRMISTENPVTAFALDYSIVHAQSRYNVNWILNARHTLTGGLQASLYKLQPGDYKGVGSESIITRETQQTERGIENAAYLGDHFEVNSKLSVYAGLRYSWFAMVGPRTVNLYTPGQPIESIYQTGTEDIQSGIVKTYSGLEPRLSARYLLPMNSSLKFSFGRTRQYLQMLSNNTAVAPSDIWKLSDTYIKPQVADQISLGWFQNRNGIIDLSVEGYYKMIHTATEFQNGARLFRNQHIETEVLNARGKAYGIELMAKKTTGRLNGWISYTYARSLMKTNSTFELEKINNNSWYRSNFDKPHALNLITNYKFNRRVNISFNTTWSTGRPITLPYVKFNAADGARLEYSLRNGFRVPAYFRSDLALNLEGNHKIKKLAHSSWTLALYNMTGRRNAYSVFFRTEGNLVKGYKLSIFGQAIPTLTWNFRI